METGAKEIDLQEQININKSSQVTMGIFLFDIGLQLLVMRLKFTDTDMPSMMQISKFRYCKLELIDQHQGYSSSIFNTKIQITGPSPVFFLIFPGCLHGLLYLPEVCRTLAVSAHPLLLHTLRHLFRRLQHLAECLERGTLTEWNTCRPN